MCVGWSQVGNLFAAEELVYFDSKSSNLGTLQSIDEAGKFSFEIETASAQESSSTVTLKPEDFVVWGGYESTPRSSQIVLADGQILVAKIQSITSTEILFKSRIFKSGRIPIEWVAGVVLQPKLNPTKRQTDFDKVFGSKTSNRLMLSSGDEIGFSRAIVEENSNGWVTLETGTANNVVRTKIEMDRVPSIVFDSTLGNAFSHDKLDSRAESVEIWFGLKDGSLLKSTQCRLGQNQLVIQLQHPKLKSIIKLDAFPDQAKTAIRMVQPMHSKVVYCSDLEPTREATIPFLDHSRPAQLNRCSNSGPLRFNGKTYIHGIGCFGSSSVVFSIDEQYREFRSEIAFDDSSNQYAHAVYRIYLLDAEDNWKLQTVSGELSRKGASINIKPVNVRGYKAIALVTDASGASVADYVDWLNCRFQK